MQGKQDALPRWWPHPKRVLKLNFGGSTFSNPGSAWAGIILRDSSVDITLRVSSPVGLSSGKEQNYERFLNMNSQEDSMVAIC